MMRTHMLDSITRRAASQINRRHSLLTLSGAALAMTAVAHPERAAARKKKGKDCQQKEQQRCESDAQACRLTVLLNCKTPGECGAGARCCDQCTATGFIRCAVGQS